MVPLSLIGSKEMIEIVSFDTQLLQTEKEFIDISTRNRKTSFLNFDILRNLLLEHY